MAYVIVPLDRKHDRVSFSCGDHLVDQFCKTAHPEHFAFKRKIYVCCAEDGKTVTGYYSISLSFLRKSKKDEKNDLAIHLEMIGVAKPLQAQGMGSALLVHALKNVAAVADIVGVAWVYLEPRNAKSEDFYKGLGFKWYGKSKMYLPIETVQALITGPSAAGR